MIMIIIVIVIVDVVCFFYFFDMRVLFKILVESGLELALLV